jgi:hypothetical protein
MKPPRANASRRRAVPDCYWRQSCRSDDGVAAAQIILVSLVRFRSLPEDGTMVPSPFFRLHAIRKIVSISSHSGFIEGAFSFSIHLARRRP